MARDNLQITIETRLRGMWRLKAVQWVLRWVRPKPLTLWLACWLLSKKVGADIKVGSRRWERGPRMEVRRNGHA